MKRHPAPILAALAAGVVLAAPAALAAEYSLANGAVRFSAPDAWPVMMDSSQGPHQFVALQVRIPGDRNALARVTVRAEKVDGLQGFQKFLNENTARARKLTGYTLTTQHRSSSEMHYTALENHERNDYTENYAYRSNLGVQVRCIRPVTAPAEWKASFDAGCKAIVAAVEK